MGKKIFLCTGEKFGRGDEELGVVLMKNFFYSLAEVEKPPDVLIFLNRGVFLTLEGSEVAQYLKKLAVSGLEILACGTCLDYYGLKEKTIFAKVSNMQTITELLVEAEQVVTL